MAGDVLAEKMRPGAPDPGNDGVGATSRVTTAPPPQWPAAHGDTAENNGAIPIQTSEPIVTSLLRSPAAYSALPIHGARRMDFRPP